MRKNSLRRFWSVIPAGTARTPGGWRFVVASRTDGDTEQNGVECDVGLTDHVARNLWRRDPAALQPDKLASLFRYRFTTDTQKRRRREALKRLREEFDDGWDFERKPDRVYARMIDRVGLMSSAATWMQARGWGRMLAKKKGCEVRMVDHFERL